ncbi:Bilirubin oxidase [Thalassoporum mexicanum PCC 7367]|uniref:multicopper oxidase family protein n=1 Tax=Thalassoporum mexicanum TaxID=3457544 RepID=UPI00029FBAA3|nr:multicopper oxidase family protein [Pseudanabaena sp. PCC 7367]AFY70015.1 Bilirubin oxidase [Pseudanabaena sp. PCC 7367]
MNKLKRRQFIVLGAAGAGLALASNWLISKNRSTLARDAEITSPQLYKSANGLLEVELEASYRSVQLGGNTASLLSYNGTIPGPRLEVNAGDTVRINFTNNLSQPTNLHYHGPHIPPTGSGDNIFLDIAPGDRFTYEFTIAKDHPAGLSWYHPHRHGYVAEQVFGGLAGLFVIRGDLDRIPEVQTAKEEFFVLQDFDLDRNGQMQTLNPMARSFGREGNVIALNGQIAPEISIPNDRFLRLRLLNASTSRFYRLALTNNHPMYLIATDGGGIAEPVEISELLMAPGERAEVLIRGEREPKTYELLNLPYDRGGMGMMGRGNMMGGFTSNNNRVLATLTCQGSVPKLSLPKQLITVNNLPEPITTRQFVLNHGMAPGMGMVFLVNGQPYEPDRIDTRVKLGTVEDWELINNGVMDHPFHLHVNPFQVISRNDVPEPYQAWRDTVLVRAGETVRIRIPFRDFAGKTVYHCHILDHEDMGMMGNLEIQA